MPKNKLAKFSAINTMPNVFQNREWHEPKLYNYQNKIINYAGNWNNTHFNNHNPLILELACGYGEYTVALAQHNVNQNFIGIDVKGNRIHTGALQATQHRLPNVAFMRSPIELLPHFFAPNEIHEIWIPFPDPYLRSAKSNKRLISPYFLDIYRKIASPNCHIHLKTDSKTLYDFAVEVVQNQNLSIVQNYTNLYEQMPSTNPILSLKTRYEKIHLAQNKTIKYLYFKLF